MISLDGLMIKSLELTNWKTHKHTKLEFQKGTNILIGKMGAGKSSVLDAISFSLFGTFPSAKHNRVNLQGIIRNVPEQEKEAYAKLVFTANGDEYTVERRIYQNKSAQATLKKNGDYLQSQPDRVNEEIAKALKVDYDVFSRAVYSEQNQLDNFLNLRSSERKKQMDELFGLDKFAISSDNATTLVNRIKDIIKEKKREIEKFNIGDIKGQLDLLRKERENLNDGITLSEKKIIEISAEMKEAEGRLVSLKELSNKKMKIANEIAELRSKIDFALKDIKKIEGKKLGTLEETESKMLKVSAMLKDARKREQELADSERSKGKEIAALESQIARAEKDMKERRRIEEKLNGMPFDDIRKKLEDETNHIRELETSLASLKAEESDLIKWIAELDKHFAKCPLCERELSEELKARLIAGKRERTEAVKADTKRHEAELEGKRTYVKKITDDLNEIKIAEERLKEYSSTNEIIEQGRRKLESAKKELETIENERRKAREDYDATLKEENSLKIAKEELSRKAMYEKEIDAMGKAADAKEKERSSINVDEKILDSMQHKVTELNSRHSSILSEISGMKMLLLEKDAQIGDKRRQIDVIEKMELDLRKKEDAVESISKFKESLEETKIELRTMLISSINNILEEIWPEIYPYRDYPSLRLDVSSDDYVLQVLVGKNGARWEKVDATASGGERSTACLALKVAFSLVLVPNLKWIILDEPTHNLDRAGINKLVTVFNETLPKIIDQIFIITHDDALRESAAAQVYVLDRDKESGGATVIGK